jgi:septal ring-binding cell division protein DamX
VDEPGIKIENRGPAPKPSKAFVVWADEGLLAGDKKSDAAAPAPTPPAPPRPAADSAAIAKLPPGFTLQLGAFKQDDQCFNLVSSLGATQHSAQVRHINSQGKPYCIVTYGNFASLEEASRASDELLSRHKKLDTWVRSWASIRNASSED